MTPPRGTAGTAADGFRTTERPCPRWQATVTDPGQRPVCRCGRERHEHDNGRNRHAS